MVILDYNAQVGRSAASQIDGDFYQTDVRSWSQQYKAFEETMGKYGRIDFGIIQHPCFVVTITDI